MAARPEIATSCEHDALPELEAMVRVAGARQLLDHVLGGHVAPGDTEGVLVAAAVLLDRAQLWLPIEAPEPAPVFDRDAPVAIPGESPCRERVAQ